MEAGGYHDRQWWSDEGWTWVSFEKKGGLSGIPRDHPRWWVKQDEDPPVGHSQGDSGSGGSGWKLRCLQEEIPMPWSWPACVNQLEAKAFCNWKSARDGVTLRLPSEAEWCVRACMMMMMMMMMMTMTMMMMMMMMMMMIRRRRRTRRLHFLSAARTNTHMHACMPPGLLVFCFPTFLTLTFTQSITNDGDLFFFFFSFCLSDCLFAGTPGAHRAERASVTPTSRRGSRTLPLATSI